MVRPRLDAYLWFNHDAAERSFVKATELDPDCAMCWWGAALVLGPHVNSGMDLANNANAWTRLQKALALSPRTTPREQAFIKRLVCALCGTPGLKIAKGTGRGLCQGCRKTREGIPEDPDAATLYAEAMRICSPGLLRQQAS